MVHGIFLSTLILVLSTILLVITILVIRTVSPKFNLTNVLVLFMVFYVVFAFAGSVILNVWYTDPGTGYLVYNRPDVLLKIWSITSLGLIGIPLFTSIILRSVGFHFVSLKPVREIPLSSFERIIIYFLFFICFLVFLTYVNKIGGIPLLRYIQDTSLTQAFLRSEATNNFAGKAWRYVLFYETIPLTLLILVSFTESKKIRNLLFLYTSFICVMSFQKGSIIKLLIIMVLIHIRKKGNIKFGQLLLVGSFGLVCLIFMYIFFMNASGSLGKLIEGILGRTFLVQIIPFFWYFKYAEMIGFLGGTSFPNPSGIFPFESARITVDVMNLYRNQAGIKTDVVGSMPTVFMADWYVNFGYIGVTISILIFTLMLVCIIIIFNKLIHRYNDTYTNAALIIVIENFAWYSGGSFTGIIIDVNLIIPLFLLFGLKCIRNSSFIFKSHSYLGEST